MTGSLRQGRASVGQFCFRTQNSCRIPFRPASRWLCASTSPPSLSRFAKRDAPPLRSKAPVAPHPKRRTAPVEEFLKPRTQPQGWVDHRQPSRFRAFPIKILGHPRSTRFANRGKNQTANTGPQGRLRSSRIRETPDKSPARMPGRAESKNQCTRTSVLSERIISSPARVLAGNCALPFAQGDNEIIACAFLWGLTAHRCGCRHLPNR